MEKRMEKTAHSATPDWFRPGETEELRLLYGRTKAALPEVLLETPSRRWTAADVALWAVFRAVPGDFTPEPSGRIDLFQAALAALWDSAARERYAAHCRAAGTPEKAVFWPFRLAANGVKRAVRGMYPRQNAITGTEAPDYSLAPGLYGTSVRAVDALDADQLLELVLRRLQPLPARQRAYAEGLLRGEAVPAGAAGRDRTAVKRAVRAAVEAVAVM